MSSSSFIRQRLFSVLLILVLLKLYSYTFAFCFNLKLALVSQYLYNQQSRSVLSLGVASFVATTSSVRFWSSLVFKSGDFFSERVAAILTRLVTLLFSNVTTVAIFNSFGFTVHNNLLSRLLQLDFIATTSVGTMLMVWLQEQLTAIGISGGISLVVLFRTLTLMLHWICTVPRQPVIGLALNGLVLGVALYFGVLVECSVREVLLAEVGNQGQTLFILLKPRAISLFPIILSSAVMQLHLGVLERISYVSIPLLENQKLCDLTKTVEILVSFLLYGLQTFYFAALSATRDSNVLSIKRCIRETELMLLLSFPNQSATKFLNSILSYLILLRVSYVVAVCLLSKLLFLKTGNVLFFYEYFLLVFVNFLVATVENLRSVSSTTNNI